MTVTVSATPADAYEFNGWTENGTTVSEDEQYTFQVNADRSLVAGFAEKPASRLPEGYTEVKYVQSDSYCSILTGCTPIASKTKIVMDICASTYISSKERIFFAPFSNSYNFYFQRADSSKLEYKFISTSSSSAKTISYNIEDSRLVIDTDLATNVMNIGENEYSISHGSGSMGSEIYLFNGLDSQRSIQAKLYSAQIYNGEQMIRDFVPCINPSNIVGLYDLIGKTFYQNAGTGELTAGPLV